MSDGKNIEIKIAATGGDQAAAEIKKVTAAATDAQETRGFGGMLDQVPERAEEAAKAQDKWLEQLAKEEEQIKTLGAEHEKADWIEIQGLKNKELQAEIYAKGLEKRTKLEQKASADQAAAFDGVASKGAVAAIAITAVAAAKTLATVFEQLEKIDDVELSKLDSQWVAQIERIKEFKQALSDPIGALVAWANDGTSVEDAFASMNEELQLGAQQRANDVDRIISRGSEQVEEIKRLTDELKSAHARLDAKDDADSAAQDRADAKAIRDGVPEEDVRANRAKINHQKGLESINREVEDKLVGLQESFELAKKQRANVEELDRSGIATPEDIKKAKAEAEQFEADFQRRNKAAEDARAIANDKRRGLNERTQGTIEDAVGDKRERQEREQQKKDQEKEREDAKREREKAAADRDREKSTSGVARQGEEAVRLLPKGVSEEFRKKVEKVSAGLQNGDQGGEVKELIKLMDQLAEAVGKKSAKGDQDMTALRNKIAVLEGQLKNNRRG